jgi:type I restriction enzyme S subunit
MFGDPVTNPMGWATSPLGERCEIITGNTPPRAEKENYGNFIEWIKTDNISESTPTLSIASEYLSKKGFKKCRYVEPNSILMTCIAGSLNSIGNVAITDRRVSFNQQINAIVPQDDNYYFLYWLFKISKRLIHNSVNMMLKGILSKGRLSGIKIPIPPLSLQNRFAAFVQQADKSKLVCRKRIKGLFPCLSQYNRINGGVSNV